MNFRGYALVLVLAVSLYGCNVDLFNSGCRDIGQSGYSLCQDEGESLYYLQRRGEGISGGGVLEGTVQTIGWNSNVIIAGRQATFRGDPDGLMVLEVNSGRLAGPVDPDELARTYPSIEQQSAAVTWSALQ
jgi:hypothetical protein